MKKIDFGSLREAVNGIRLSVVEWVALGSVLAFAAYVVFFYFNSTQPLKIKLEALKQREKTLLALVKDETSKKQAVEEQRANAEKIMDSLQSFESRLRSRKQGIPAIIDEVNQLAKANRVHAGDLSFRTDAPAALTGEAQPGASPSSVVAQRQGDKLLNVYEGLGIDTTVEGDYHDLRRFISALERSQNFVIINAIALQSIDEKSRTRSRLPGPVAPRPQGPPGQPPAPVIEPAGPPMEGPGGVLAQISVSLKIEMETHFSRDTSLGLNPGPLPVGAPAPGARSNQ